MTKEEAKKHFWMDTDEFGESVAKRFGSINYQKIFTGYYMGSEIDKFIDKIYDSFEAELKAKNEELKELKDMKEWIEENSNSSLCDYYNSLPDA